MRLALSFPCTTAGAPPRRRLTPTAPLLHAPVELYCTIRQALALSALRPLASAPIVTGKVGGGGLGRRKV